MFARGFGFLQGSGMAFDVAFLAGRFQVCLILFDCQRFFRRGRWLFGLRAPLLLRFLLRQCDLNLRAVLLTRKIDLRRIVEGPFESEGLRPPC
jgi:hypothetical protein